MGSSQTKILRVSGTTGSTPTSIDLAYGLALAQVEGSSTESESLVA